MKFVRFTKIIYVRNSWCIVRTLNTLIHTLNALMYTLIMHHNARVNDASWYTRWWCIIIYAWMRMRCSLRRCAYNAVCVNAHAMQSAWIRMRCSLREYACDAVCVNAHAMQFAWMRMRCSLRKCAYDAVYVFAKSVKPAKPLLPDPNDHYRFQIIMLAEIWFKSVSQLITSSGINSLDLINEIFCWCLNDFIFY